MLVTHVKLHLNTACLKLLLIWEIGDTLLIQEYENIRLNQGVISDSYSR